LISGQREDMLANNTFVTSKQNCNTVIPVLIDPHSSFVWNLAASACELLVLLRN